VLIVAVAGALVIAAVLMLWWGRRQRALNRRRLGGAAMGLGATVLALGVAGVGVGIWAFSATDTSQLARAIVWQDSSFDDSGRFPFRAFSASSDPVTFSHVAGSPLEGFRVDATGEALESFLGRTETTAFIVLHGDVLLYEAYFNGSNREATQTSFSVAKSFTATLVGIALEEGFISSLDDPLTDYLPELIERDPRFGDITLRHAITMSSGLGFREGASPWDDPANTYYGTDLRTAALTKTEIEVAPGREFHYNDWNLVLMGVVLERTTGMSLSAYMETRLWQPMGAEADGSWSLDSETSGFEKVFVGINARAIDFAKLGWLYLNEGRSRDHQVVPAAFVDEATRVDTTTDPASHYQYYWWIDEDRNSYYAQGDHCQYIYVDPDADVALVRHGSSCGDSENVDVDWAGFLGGLVDWLEPQLRDG
jgi:CubicO group peptidase (beta-lactamase class C family)